MSSASRRPSTTDNLLLLLALVPYVLDRGEVPVAQAAEQFGRSEDDIVKAIELIACAGIPGDSLAYSHLDLFDIDWDLWEEQRVITFWNTVAIDHQPRFSAREASALLAGLQYLATHPSYSHRSDIDEVMTKLRAGAGAGPADRIAVGGEAVETHLVVLEEALSTQRAVTMTYHNKRGESGQRTIDPLLIETRDAQWYVRGWCHTRQALRTFRVNHMEAVSLSELKQGDHSSLIEDISTELFSPSPDDIMVTIECSASSVPLIADYLPRGVIPSGAADPLRLEIPFAHYGSLTRFVAAHPGRVRVVAPPSAREAVTHFAGNALARYETR
jgi:proteasome accessory factor C